MMFKKLIKISLGLLVAGYTSGTFAADIYRSQLPDGSARYASQALDASYELYARDEKQPAEIPAKPSPLPQTSARNTPQALDFLIVRLAQKHAVDSALVRAVIEIESNFNPNALSRKGAMGAMQLMPATAASYGVTNRADTAQNIEAGIRHLKYLLALHDGNIALALASYNAGQGAVKKHGQRIPPYPETMLYVPAVLAKFQAARTTKLQ
jgi:soluble lytic murein transglycosylase-like protein